MKKFLSLVLALVMTMSLVTISAGAKDFTDDSKITYEEAVDVVSAVKVVDGYADGSFNPNATLTRGAAAKIICNLILGPTTAGALSADAAPYKDVPANSTFAGYIAYCQKEGIISGYADGTFRPGNTLTGYAFMKMLLGALGYDKAVEGYEGANWSINVAKRALNIGLDKGLTEDFNGVKPVTREEACLYAFNTLKATMVEYENSSTIVVGDITVTSTSKASEMKWYELVGGDDEDYDGSADNRVQFCEKYFPKLSLTKTATDVYGRPANYWTYKNDEVGTYAKEADAVYTSNPKMYKVNKDLGYATNETANFYYVLNSAKTQKVGTNKITVNYYQSTSTVELDDFDALNAYLGNGVTVEVFYDDKLNSDQNKIVVIDEYFDEVKAVKSDDDGTYVTLKNSMAGKKFYTEDFEKGDKVLFTVGQDGGDKIASMKPAEKLTGKLTTIDGSKYVIDGTTYKLHLGTTGLTTVGKDVDFYLDSNGYIIKIDLTEASDAVEDLAIVYAKNTGAWKTEAKVVYASGKIEVVDLKDTAASDKIVYTFSMDSNKLKVEARTDYTTYYGNDGSNGYYFTKGATKITNGASTEAAKVDSKTTFVLFDTAPGKDTVKVYVGNNNAPTFSAGTKIWAYKKNTASAASVVFVEVPENNLSSSLKDLVFAIVDKYDVVKTTNDSGDSISYYNVRTLDGSVIKTTINATNGIAAKYSNYVNAGVVVYKSANTDSNGRVTAFTPETDKVFTYNSSLTVKESNGVLYFGGSNPDRTYADNVEVYEIADDGDSFEKLDADYLSGLEESYAGYTYVTDKDYVITTLVLKKNPA